MVFNKVYVTVKSFANKPCIVFYRQREVALYLRTRNGKVDGAESAPFVLPHRWTFATLMSCIEDNIKRTNDIKEIKIKQLYYKKAKGKGIVKLNGDCDVSCLLKEYPLTYQSGKRRKESTMYLAVDWEIVGMECYEKKMFYYSILFNLFFSVEANADFTPRKSPRIQAKGIDIFVHQVNQDLKISTNSDVIHKVRANSSVADVKSLLESYGCTEKVYVPTKGLYWIRKGTKQLVSLRNDEDLATCKQEYTKEGIRIACRAFSLAEDGQGNIITRNINLKMS